MLIKNCGFRSSSTLLRRRADALGGLRGAGWGRGPRAGYGRCRRLPGGHPPAQPRVACSAERRDRHGIALFVGPRGPGLRSVAPAAGHARSCHRCCCADRQLRVFAASAAALGRYEPRPSTPCPYCQPGTHPSGSNDRAPMKILPFLHELAPGGATVNAIEPAATLRDRHGHDVGLRLSGAMCQPMLVTDMQTSVARLLPGWSPITLRTAELVPTARAAGVRRVDLRLRRDAGAWAHEFVHRHFSLEAAAGRSNGICRAALASRPRPWRMFVDGLRTAAIRFRERRSPGRVRQEARIVAVDASA